MTQDTSKEDAAKADQSAAAAAASAAQAAREHGASAEEAEKAAVAAAKAQLQREAETAAANAVGTFDPAEDGEKPELYEFHSICGGDLYHPFQSGLKIPTEGFTLPLANDDWLRLQHAGGKLERRSPGKKA